MNKLKSSLAAKLIAALLILVTLAAALCSIAGVALMEGLGAYPDEHDRARSAVVDSLCQSRSYEAVYDLSNYVQTPDEIYPDSAFCFTVADSQGNIIYDNLGGRAVASTSETVDFACSPAFFQGSAHTVYVVPERDGQYGPLTTASPEPTVTPEASATTEDYITSDVYIASDAAVDTAQDESGDMTRRRYTFTGYMLKTIPADDDAALVLRLFELGYPMRYGLFAIATVSLIISVLLFAFLMAAAGHRPGSDGVCAGILEKIPFDVYTALVVCGETLICVFISEVTGGSYMHWSVRLILSCFAVAAFLLVALLWCMGWATRIKLHTALKSCLCYRILAWLWRGVKKLWDIAAQVIKDLPLVRRAALITLGVLFVEFIYLLMSYDDGGALVLGWFFERAVLAALLLYALLGMKKLLAAGKEIAAGNLSYTVDTSKMRGVVKEHGEDLNNISAGLNRAVEERMKSERFKTELITNVSHDIRTPLTSIISYVDLLAKEEPESGKEREYIEVLKRQSARLKKLIDDLIEASKASSGTLAVNAESCDMGVLIDQLSGEYAEKLEQAGLELVKTVPEERVCVIADGRHMWRIFDNLFNNVCKYSQRGTRVYLDVRMDGASVAVSVKNISGSRLNISGDELMERFVRGDSARNTEGSGLGLSIARSLTQLQHGTMAIDIDGDLFKITLRFPAQAAE